MSTFLRALVLVSLDSQPNGECLVAFVDTTGVEIGRKSLHGSTLRVEAPQKRDAVIVCSGEFRGMSGNMLGLDVSSGDAIITVQNQEIKVLRLRSEEHTSELQSLIRISYAVFCLKKKKK